MDGPSLSVEETDNRLRRIRELVERRDDWFGNKRPNIAERYLNSQLNLVVRVNRAARQHVAIVRRLLPHEFIEYRGEASMAVDADAVRRRISLHQAPMLSNNVKVMEVPQKFSNMPSAVWLEHFDCHLISSGKPLYLFTSAAVKVVDGKADREVDIFFSDMSVSLGEFVGEEVETASRGIDDKAGFSIDDAWNRLNFVDLPTLFAGLRIVVSCDGVWATVDPALNPFAESIELGYGPINAA